MKMKLLFALISSIALLATSANAFKIKPVSEQLRDPEAADVTIIGHVLEPKQVSVNGGVQRIALPPGFEINVFAADLTNPRMLAVAEDGTVYVTERSAGDVVMLRDDDGDGQADQREVVANRPDMHGIAIDGNTMYLVTVNDIYRTTIQEDGRLAPLEHLVDDLPEGGQHPNRTIVVGPDEKLYVSVGSTCNACGETNPENATILRVEPDGSYRTIFASGLRNTIGFGFEPQTGELWGMDHGIDWLGDNEQHEELNHIVWGHRYGWPYVYDDSKLNPQDEPPGDISIVEWAAQSVEPVGFYTPHAAPMQMIFYTGEQFPGEFQGDAFVAFRGSWNRKPPSGYEVVRIRFENGKPVAFEAFAQGFLSREGKQWIHKGRLAGVAQAGDGALLVTDDTNGIIYRIGYTGNENDMGEKVGPPTNSRGANIRVTDRGVAPPVDEDINSLAIEQLNPNNDEPLKVESPAFANGEPIPNMYAAEGENISPPLQWSEGPEGTKTYVVVMEDPDVPQDPPFIHWLLYNVPAGVTALNKAVPPLPQPPKPEGALQGENERGSMGYFGPKPPVGDSAHHYHFQVFALDTELDLPFGASQAELVNAMQGHVLAAGEVVGIYSR